MIDVRDGHEFAAAAHASGTTLETWFVLGSGHTLAMVDQAVEFERRIVAFFRAAFRR